MFVLNLLAGITAVLGGYYRFLKFSRVGNELEEYKKKNSRIWERIDNSKFRELPAIVIRWYLRLSEPFKSIYRSIERRNLSKEFIARLALNMVRVMIILTILMLFLEPHLASFALLVVLLYGIVVVLTEDKMISSLIVFPGSKTLLIMLLSCLITSSALVLGGDLNWDDVGFFRPTENAQLVGQVFLSNIIFDLLTVYITYFILKRAINNIQFLLLFITFDIIMSACFSIYSIYFGLLGTEQSINLLEATHMLIGLSPDGSLWQFGSYFWAMHTTFIPTLIYLSVLVLMITAKYVTMPIARLFYRASLTEEPHMMYAFFYITLSGIFLLVSFVMGHYLKSPS